MSTEDYPPVFAAEGDPVEYNTRVQALRRAPRSPSTCQSAVANLSGEHLLDRVAHIGRTFHNGHTCGGQRRHLFRRPALPPPGDPPRQTPPPPPRRPLARQEPGRRALLRGLYSTRGRPLPSPPAPSHTQH